MRYLLMFAGTAVGRVELDDGEPAAGPLEPFPPYERVAPLFRRAGNALWQARFRTDVPFWREWAAEAVAEAERAKAHLALATEAGTMVPCAVLDFWDSTLHGEPPLVLAYQREQPAAAPARVPPPPVTGGEGSRGPAV